jgi:hypothetical protein
VSTRAERLRADLDVEKLAGIPRVLAEEMCLTLERMEHLDKTLQGDADAWLGILERLPDGYAEVVILAPLAEVRQQGAAFKGLAAEFAKAIGGAEPAQAPVSTSDDLAVARETRKQAALAAAKAI